MYRFGQTPVGEYTPEKHFWMYFPCGKTFPAILVRNSVKAKKEKTDKQTNMKMLRSSVTRKEHLFFIINQA